MRRVLLFALAACLALLAGCGVEDVLGDMMGPREPQATAVPSPTEVPIWTPPAATDAPAAPQTDAPAQAGGIADYGSLTVADCVEDGWTYPNVIPRIKLNCPGAESINAAIQGTFVELAEDPMFEVHYECAIGAGRYLSVLMVEKINDSLFHTAYNLDLATGEQITGSEMLTLLGQDEGALKSNELELMGEEFTRQYGALIGQMDQNFYDMQYARTTAIGNADTENLWFGTDGQLYFAGKLYSMAGAEYYEYPIPTGLFF